MEPRQNPAGYDELLGSNSSSPIVVFLRPVSILLTLVGVAVGISANLVGLLVGITSSLSLFLLNIFDSNLVLSANDSNSLISYDDWQ